MTDRFATLHSSAAAFVGAIAMTAILVMAATPVIPIA